MPAVLIYGFQWTHGVAAFKQIMALDAPRLEEDQLQKYPISLAAYKSGDKQEAVVGSKMFCLPSSGCMKVYPRIDPADTKKLLDWCKKHNVKFQPPSWHLVNC